MVIKEQKPTEDDFGSVKFGKVINRLNTLIFPLAVTFVLNIALGVSYPFCFVLFFLAFVPMLLFNAIGLHKKMCSHKIFKVLA